MKPAKELLSNEEIDTLLHLFRSEGAPLAVAQDATRLLERVGGDDPVEIDLLKPNRLGREQMRGFERLFGGCAKLLAATMSDRLRLDMVCDCVAVEQMRFATWARLLSTPSAIYVLEMPPLEMPVLLAVTTSVLYGAVDRILGGTGKVQEERQDFTAAEYIVADAFVGPCLDRICESLRDLALLSWRIQSRSCTPSVPHVLADQDVLVAVHFQVSSESLLGDLRLVLPYAALEPQLAKLRLGPSTRTALAPGALRAMTERTVKSVPVTLSVLLGETNVPLRQLLDLQVGDVVVLPTRVGTPLVAPVQGRPKFVGQIGTHGNRLAFQVGAAVEE